MAVKRPPGPKGNLFFGSVSDFREDQPEFLTEIVKQYGDLVHMRLLNYHMYVLGSPDLVHEVLIKQSDKFGKAEIDRKILGKFLGNGLLTSEGDFHRRQRRLAQPAFHMKRINAYSEVMVQFANQMLAEWQPGETRDIAEEMVRLTMFIVSKTLFDVDVEATAENMAERVGHAIHDLQVASNRDYERGILLPDWLPTANNRRRREALATFNEVVERIIAERRATAVNGRVDDRGDLLSMLMLSQDEDGSFMDDQQLRDEVATLFAAGHETTSNALSWTWYLLSQNPEAEAKLHAELDAVLGGRTPALADLPNLPYTQMVIKESMRLIPPVWVLNARTALEDVEIGDYTIPKGDTVFISPYVMHHLPQNFPDPERFDPERFTPEQEKARHKFAYMPFGGGSRVCIGNSFAMMEAQLVLATVAQRFQLRLVPNQPVVPEPMITTSPKYGLKMTLEARETAVPAEPVLAMAAD